MYDQQYVETATAAATQKGDADKGMSQQRVETATAVDTQMTGAQAPPRKRKAAQASAGQDIRMYVKSASITFVSR